MLSVLFLPSFVYVALQSSSLALGLLISFGISFILIGKNRIPKIKNRFAYLISWLLLLQFLYSLLFMGETEAYNKQLMSFVMLILMFISSAFYSMEIEKVSDKKLVYFLKILSLSILFLGFLSQFESVSFLHYSNFSKAVFPYSEPSHYVLANGGILLATGFFISSTQRVLLLLSLIFLTIKFPSTLLLFLSILMLIIYYSSDLKKVFLLSTLLVIAFLFINNNFEDFKYFSERLNTSSSNHNLTTLVYLQGADDAYQSLIVTNGIGLGFQNMGALPPSDISELIYSLSGYYKNRNDGGFLAAKIIGEFGIIGLMLILLYIKKLYKSFFFLREIASDELALYQTKSWLILAHSIIVVFSIEMFVRGYGPFSPGVFLVIFSLFLVQKGGKS